MMKSSGDIGERLPWHFLTCKRATGSNNAFMYATSFTFFIGTRHALLQALISALITALMAFSKFQVFSLQHPFAGDVSVGKDHLKTWQSRLTKEFPTNI